jgi:hypothetical protein
VKHVCIGHGVSVIFLGAYRTCALQVQKVSKQLPDSDPAVAARALEERCTEKGLRRWVVASIAFDVLNVEVAEQRGLRPRPRYLCTGLTGELDQGQG